MGRNVDTVRQTITNPEVSHEFEADPKTWLTQRAVTHDLQWLLVHADDGVIWGIVDNGTLQLSHDHFPAVSPPLRSETIQQVRLFDSNGELFVWRSEDQFQARLVIEEESGEPVEIFDERQFLWGTHADQYSGRFTLLRQGAEGVRHAPPLTVDANEKGEILERPYLQTRHVVDYEEETGQAYVVWSRLVSLERNPEGETE